MIRVIRTTYKYFSKVMNLNEQFDIKVVRAYSLQSVLINQCCGECK